MSMAPANDETDPDGESGKQADAMKDRLRKDVASWSAARSATHTREVADASVPVPPQSAAQRPATRAKRLKPVAPDAGKPATAAGKPFRMSYDGMTDADYISSIIERGA
ncbi:MAG TPA: hypothetical protein VND19_19795 [Acetobacteraceae bacterium]|nr:hypothetical protein [Acetobacteraceae bacterium]